MPTDTWDDFAADWDSRSDVRRYTDLAFESWNRRVAPLVSNIGELKILDFGCGTGLLTEKLATLVHSVVAVDTSAGMINVLNDKIRKSGVTNVTSLVGTIDPDSILSNKKILNDFDVVVASSVCSFLPDFETTLCHISEIMNPGGIFVQWDWAKMLPADEIKHAYSAANMNCIRAEEEFTMDGEKDPSPVIMGIGQLP